MEHLFNDNYLIYKVADTNLYAAIPYPLSRDIRQYATEYQGLAFVPADKCVKGILFEADHDHLIELKTEQVELPINRLQFDAGDLRLSA